MANASVRSVVFCGAVSLAAVFSGWVFPQAVWGQAGCCETPEGCFETDDPAACKRVGGLFFQRAICGQGRCEPSVPSGDRDGDGFPDEIDTCPDSLLDPTVVMHGEDSGVRNLEFGDGCTLADLVDECILTAPDHGDFVSCVAQLAIDLVKADLLSAKEAVDLGLFAASLQDSKCECKCKVLKSTMKVKGASYVDKFSDLKTPYQTEDGKMTIHTFDEVASVELTLTLGGKIQLAASDQKVVVVNRGFSAEKPPGVSAVLLKRKNDKKHTNDWYFDGGGKDKVYEGKCKGTKKLKDRELTFVVINVQKGKTYKLYFYQSFDNCKPRKSRFIFEVKLPKKTGKPSVKRVVK